MGLYEISVEHAFSASHAVALAGGGYEPSHFHLWHVQAKFRAPVLDKQGMVVDFLAVKGALEALAVEFDGSDLNALRNFADCGATAEAVAEMFARGLMQRVAARLYCLCVTEAPGCAAAFYPSGP
jgi:6-pyruvoyltetrahydropterin/6-carboxytetrahydropterin synthase